MAETLKPVPSGMPSNVVAKWDRLQRMNANYTVLPNEGIPTSVREQVDEMNLEKFLGNELNVGSKGEISIDQIDYAKIASNMADAQNNRFINENNIYKQYWENGSLTYEVVADNVLLIYKDGVPLGYTTLDKFKDSKKSEMNEILDQHKEEKKQETVEKTEATEEKENTASDVEQLYPSDSIGPLDPNHDYVWGEEAAEQEKPIYGGETIEPADPNHSITFENQGTMGIDQSKYMPHEQLVNFVSENHLTIPSDNNPNGGLGQWVDKNGIPVPESKNPLKYDYKYNVWRVKDSGNAIDPITGEESLIILDTGELKPLNR